MRERAILVGTILGRGSPQEEEESLQELARLADTAGAAVIDTEVQRRPKPDAATFIGKGKAAEIGLAAARSGAGLVIFDHDLSPSQAFKLGEIIGCRVIDRAELIMDIFALRARTAEAKIQVELAQLLYRFSRLTGAGIEMSDPGGGIGTRGPGEKQLELDRRKIRDRIARLKRDLKGVEQQRRTQRKSRSGMFQVALVGYTNAGKSTLMNLLAKAKVKVEDRLFATLDATTRQVVLAGGERFLLTDTVGFIRRLPHQLVASFRATLEEVVEADLVLHVVDTPHAARRQEIEAVRAVLQEIAAAGPELMVFNKIDRMDDHTLGELRWGNQDAAFVSALTGGGRRELEQMIVRAMRDRR
ncbi:MAG TPA: GTPase HflX [Candidatus Edwardsbacteria bacterium]|nr:GTPase HflX [Candidatus Edwardsbacteria bacterium]